jgi:hypothetical protein
MVVKWRWWLSGGGLSIAGGGRLQGPGCWRYSGGQVTVAVECRWW